MESFNWVKFHDQVKVKYLKYAPNMWWGDDLDIRFFLLKKLVEIRNNKILDVGCNIGLTLSYLDCSNTTYGIDISEECVEKARELSPSSHLSIASMDNLEMFDDNFFDVIIMGNVLPGYDFVIEENQEDFINKTLKEVARVLKDTGKIYFTTPNGESIHYANGRKVGFDKLREYISGSNLTGEILGWNSIRPIAYSNISNKYRFIPPKILCKSNFVWNKLISDMHCRVKLSKYYYAELKKL